MSTTVKLNMDGIAKEFVIVHQGNDDETYLRPALILPSNLLVSDDGSVSANTAPSMNGGITIPDTIQGGSTIPISWSAATDAEGNLEGYIVERSIDGGQSWTQIYQGGATQTTNTVAFGTYSVMYRVRAYDSEGLYSGCRTSSQVLVINNSAPGVPASITVPAEVTGGSAVTVTWGPASDADGDLAGYSLERQVDGGEWTVVYSGNTLSYTDQTVKGWASVAYRVRAFDTHNAYGGYAASPGCLIFVSRSHRKDDLPFPPIARSAFYQKIRHIFLASAK